MSIENQLRNVVPAVLVLADGSVFSGVSVGAEGETVGEVVFNTAITGYQEILTDPSYTEQLVTLTYPHIGNTGINPEDYESDRVHAAGLIIRECSPIVSNWRATESLPDYLKRNKVVAIANIDTRRLTHLLRDKGAQSGCIMTGKVNIEIALQKAKNFSGLNGKDLAKVVSIIETRFIASPSESTLHIVVYDFGVKENIIRALQNRNCKVTVVPAKTSVDDVLRLHPDGIVLSNGPGDPAACDYAIENTKILLTKQIPIFGICLGFQIVALALGAKTQKMKFGHHGANHPVGMIGKIPPSPPFSKGGEEVHEPLPFSKKGGGLNESPPLKKGVGSEASGGISHVYITSQNHGFCVDEKTLPTDVEVTHISLFDKSLQGFKHNTLPVMAFQGHPEAGPGPNDILCLFDDFLAIVKTRLIASQTEEK